MGGWVGGGEVGGAVLEGVLESVSAGMLDCMV